MSARAWYGETWYDETWCNYEKTVKEEIKEKLDRFVSNERGRCIKWAVLREQGYTNRALSEKKTKTSSSTRFSSGKCVGEWC